MSRRIDYRSSSEYAADDVAAVMLDESYLRARLAELGGPGAKLLEHRLDDGGGQYRIRHGVDRSMIPPFVASLLTGNLIIDRTEGLYRKGPGHYAGDVSVRLPGTPATAAGGLTLRDLGGRSELHVTADVTVDVPFLGGKIESVIAEQVQNLLAAETRFTLDWLARKKTT